MRNTFKGTCQVCGFLESVIKESRVLIDHQCPSTWNFFSGLCGGSGKAPFELSGEAIAPIIESVSTEAERLRALAKDCRRNTSPIVERSNQGGWEKFDLTQENRHIWRTDTGENNIADAIARYNWIRAYPWEKETLLRDTYVVWQQKRLAAWQPTELIPNQAKELIKAANQAKWLAVREAKQFTKPAEETNDYRREMEGRDPGSLLQDPNYIGQKIREARAHVVVAARRAFARGDRAVIFQIKELRISAHKEVLEKSVYEEVHNMQELQHLLDSNPSDAPQLSCARCKQKFQFSFGELRCQCCKSLDAEELDCRVNGMSLAARALARGDKLVHVLTYWQGGGGEWHDIASSEELECLLQGDKELMPHVVCSTCKAPMSFDLGELHCECTPKLSDSMPELASTRAPTETSVHEYQTDWEGLGMVTVKVVSLIASSADLHSGDYVKIWQAADAGEENED